MQETALGYGNLNMDYTTC